MAQVVHKGCQHGTHVVPMCAHCHHYYTLSIIHHSINNVWFVYQWLYRWCTRVHRWCPGGAQVAQVVHMAQVVHKGANMAPRWCPCVPIDTISTPFVIPTIQLIICGLCINGCTGVARAIRLPTFSIRFPSRSCIAIEAACVFPVAAALTGIKSALTPSPPHGPRPPRFFHRQYSELRVSLFYILVNWVLKLADTNSAWLF